MTMMMTMILQNVPTDALSEIAMHLASSMELYGLRGPGVVIQDVLNFGEAVTMFRAGENDVTRDALRWIERQPLEKSLDLKEDPVLNDTTGEIDWDRVVSDPSTLTFEELRRVEDRLGLKRSDTTSSRTKSIVTILHHFGLKNPRRIPARCQRILYLEKITSIWSSNFRSMRARVLLGAVRIHLGGSYSWRDVYENVTPIYPDLNALLVVAQERLKLVCECGKTAARCCRSNCCKRCCTKKPAHCEWHSN